jgi:hypothetical protein
LEFCYENIAKRFTCTYFFSDIKEMLEENQRLSEIVHCKLCVTGEPDILFLPCAHHKICHKCSENLTHCPICRKQIKQKVKTYRS